jgi:ABC-type antimicrobial peptide transport system permease subunit
VLQMFSSSVQLFLRGKLFRDGRQVFSQWLKGFLSTLGLLLVVGWVFNPLVGVILGSLVGGALQPYLFKDLKYN